MHFIEGDANLKRYNILKAKKDRMGYLDKLESIEYNKLMFNIIKNEFIIVDNKYEKYFIDILKDKKVIKLIDNINSMIGWRGNLLLDLDEIKLIRLSYSKLIEKEKIICKADIYKLYIYYCIRLSKSLLLVDLLKLKEWSDLYENVYRKNVKIDKYNIEVKIIKRDYINVIDYLMIRFNILCNNINERGVLNEWQIIKGGSSK